MGLDNTLTELPVTIASGGSQSGIVNLGGLRLVGIRMPAGWDAAGLTFLALTSDGTTWAKVVDAAGTEISLATPTAATVMHIPEASQPRGLGAVKVRSGNAATPVNQTADRKLVLLVTDL